MSRVKEIYLHGSLGEQYGKAAIKVIGDNIHCIITCLHRKYPGLKYHLTSGRWVVHLGKPEEQRYVSLGNIHEVITDDELHIIPAVEGSEAATIIAVVVGVIVAAATLFMMPKINLGDTEDKPSYMFNGSKNVIDQGGPVPMVYGISRVGTTVISSGIYAEELQKYRSQVGMR